MSTRSQSRRQGTRKRRPRSPRPADPPRLTRLRRARAGRVALELDGRPWRTVPDDVVVRCGLAVGRELDRPLLRELRRELRRGEALAVAGRTLARRDLSSKRLEERLRRRGVAPAAERSALAALERAGVVDDARVARTQAGALAERGFSDRAIGARLADEGIGAEHVREALAALAPESERARALAAAAGGARRAWARLARRGYAPDVIEEAVSGLDADPAAG